ncbi:MAG: TetR/AcrR family transcriptional regulator [Eubacteriales bacterium]|nr:TetR/AcrR family transcriptional regulator [Eubacteriales bacterium]
MNKVVTSREEILKVSRNMVLEKGMDSFSMRTVAGQCGVAVGSIYNYFPSKADLLSATIESVWEEIFKPLNSVSEFHTFVDCVTCMFETIKKGNESYPGFFTVHSLNFASEDKDKGKAMMKNYFDALEDRLVDSLERDKNIRKGVFQNKLSKRLFANYVFTLLISVLLRNKEGHEPLLEMIRNCIYET